MRGWCRSSARGKQRRASKLRGSSSGKRRRRRSAGAGNRQERTKAFTIHLHGMAPCMLCRGSVCMLLAAPALTRGSWRGSGQLVSCNLPELAVCMVEMLNWLSVRECCCERAVAVICLAVARNLPGMSGRHQTATYWGMLALWMEGWCCVQAASQSVGSASSPPGCSSPTKVFLSWPTRLLQSIRQSIRRKPAGVDRSASFRRLACSVLMQCI